MKVAKLATALGLIVGLTACSVYKPSPKMNYYHGRNVPEGYITVARLAGRGVGQLIISACAQYES